MTDVEESIIDMLIYVLSDLLWQPDYTPRVEIGLPQINLDAPRLLAHCFLYELDQYLASNKSRNFVRYMDDIDIGVDSIVEAKKTLRSVDLVLQARHIRLNSGKTRILTRDEAINHFRIFENARLDALQTRIERRLSLGLSVDRDKRLIEMLIRIGINRNHFDEGNGEKILKRLITLASRVSARIAPQSVARVLRLRPSVRENLMAYVRSRPLTQAMAESLSATVKSGWLTDDASLIDVANYLVETNVSGRHGRANYIDEIISALDPRDLYGFYCRIWLQSKYSPLDEIMQTIKAYRSVWLPHDRLGRVVGALTPLFHETKFNSEFQLHIISSLNPGARDAYKFQFRLSRDAKAFGSMFPALSNPNPSRGTGITHPKFLCLLSALQNKNAPTAQRDKLRAKNSSAFDDVYYRGIAKRLKLI